MSADPGARFGHATAWADGSEFLFGGMRYGAKGDVQPSNELFEV